MHKQVNELQIQVDRFVAVSLLINDELLDADLAGLNELFDQREKCLQSIQELLTGGEVLNEDQRSLLAHQDEFTVSLIKRLQCDLRSDMARANLEKLSRSIYSESSDSIYELTG